MFTGIIEQQGTIESLERKADGAWLRVRAAGLASQLQIAGSVAVNGCCLTVVEKTGDGFAADLSPETLRRTTFGTMKLGTRVNLERPLGAGAELGGHFVQGHIDGVGRVVAALALETTGGKRNNRPSGSAAANWWLEITLPKEVVRYVAEKGSLAVDGISLTVAEARGGRAAFAIIPYTYSHTNIQTLVKGSLVNLEADVLAKYVERIFEARTASSPAARRHNRKRKR